MTSAMAASGQSPRTTCARDWMPQASLSHGTTGSRAMQLAAAGVLADAIGATAAQAQPAADPVIGGNMHRLPENLFTDEQLVSAFVESVPREYGIHAKVAPVLGKAPRQIIIEQPAGY